MRIEIRNYIPSQRKYPYAILCVHGASGGAWYFDDVLKKMKDLGYASYAMSLRGHGTSSGKEHIHEATLDDYVKDVRHAIEIIGEKVILLGHSMGGAIVQKFMSQYSEDILAAILVSSPPPSGIHEDSKLGLFFKSPRTFLREIRKQELYQHIKLEDLFETFILNQSVSKQDILDIRSQLCPESTAVYQDLMKPYVSQDQVIKVPVFVIGSKQDRVITYKDIMLQEEKYQTKAYLLEHASHFLTLDPFRHEFIDLLVEVLSMAH